MTRHKELQTAMDVAPKGSVGEFLKTNELYIKYSLDRNVVLQNVNAPVLASAIVRADGSVKYFAFLFRSARLLIGIQDGERRTPKEVLGTIDNMRIEKQELADESVRKEVFANAL